MYHRTAIYAVGEDLLPEVEVEADDARVWIRFGRDMSLWLDYKQAGVLVDQLVAQLPPETEADYGGHLEVS